MKKIHELFDHTYIINLDTPAGQDRLVLMEKECQNIELEYELFNAVNGFAEDIVWDDTNSESMEGWTKGAAGLVHTTINIINDAKQKGYKNILILEDDLVFTPNAVRDVNEFMDGVPKNWELLHFVAHHRIAPQWVAPRVHRLEKSWSCQMYAINQTIYDLYLGHLNMVDRPIDLITSDAIHPRGKSYTIHPAIVKTVPNFSTIRNKYINHGV